MMSKPAGNEELRAKVLADLRASGIRVNDENSNMITAISDLITASNKQLLRELETQAVEIATGYVPSEYKEIKAVPLEVIQAKLEEL